MKKAKTVLVGVTGGIAVYKAASLVSELKKQGHCVYVMMTEHACAFMPPLTFETLSGNPVAVELFARAAQHDVQHISWAKLADAVVIVPATANAIAKFAHGLADDFLTTTVLAARCPKIICPAMNTAMLYNPATARNIGTLRQDGWIVADSEEGFLACGDEGAGRLASLPAIHAAIYYALADKRDLQGKKVVVTAGPTREPIDPVRFLSNPSSGKMGVAIAAAAARRGADTVLVAGPAELQTPFGVRRVDVTTAAEMASAVEGERYDIFVSAAAVADYAPERISPQKIKKGPGDLTLKLTRTADILAEAGERKAPGQLLCGFAMETEHLVDNARKKLLSKNCDLIVANDLGTPGAGFGVDTNVITLISAAGEKALPLAPKTELADLILDELLSL